MLGVLQPTHYDKSRLVDGDLAFLKTYGDLAFLKAKHNQQSDKVEKGDGGKAR